MLCLARVSKMSRCGAQRPQKGLVELRLARSAATALAVRCVFGDFDLAICGVSGNCLW